MKLTTLRRHDVTNLQILRHGLIPRQSTFPMSNIYAPIDDNDEEEYHLKSDNAPNSADTLAVSVGKGIMGLLLILTFLNMILAVTNGYYSLRITKLLQQYEEKPLSSLPRIDPFNGQYRPPLADY